MGRWRPPRKAGSPYITPTGYRALQDELEAMWPRRREVVAALSAAAAEGDRSENAEYIYRKKELAGIDRRIRYLQKRMPNLEVVRHSVPPDRVFFGATVTLDVGKEAFLCYRLVGEDEADPANGNINVDSPVAQALMKKSVGDEVLIIMGTEQLAAVIQSIEYDIEGGAQ
ncbi:MAG: GreA/GreB family elongation factor [Woeseiaceae bacterium]